MSSIMSASFCQQFHLNGFQAPRPQLCINLIVVILSRALGFEAIVILLLQYIAWALCITSFSRSDWYPHADQPRACWLDDSLVTSCSSLSRLIGIHKLEFNDSMIVHFFTISQYVDACNNYPSCHSQCSHIYVSCSPYVHISMLSFMSVYICMLILRLSFHVSVSHPLSNCTYISPSTWTYVYMYMFTSALCTTFISPCHHSLLTMLMLLYESIEWGC
jgi:hypothetical protein